MPCLQRGQSGARGSDGVRSRRGAPIAGLFDIRGADAVGQEAEVAHAGKPRREDVHGEPAQELDCRQDHVLVPIAIGVVAPGEGDVLAVEGDDAAIGDGDAMGVGREICQHVIRSAEGWFDVGVPVGLCRTARGADRAPLDRRRLPRARRAIGGPPLGGPRCRPGCGSGGRAA